MSANIAALLYLVAGVLFILALRGLSNPATSRRGNLFGMIGMTIAILTTLAAHPPAGYSWILVVIGMGIGGGIGAVTARRVPMTMMPSALRCSRKPTQVSSQRPQCQLRVPRLIKVASPPIDSANKH